MIFADVPAGAALFIDANPFVYHFVPHPAFRPACEQLLERISRQELFGFNSTDVLSDVAHRVMTMEAMTQYGWPATGIAQRLRRHPTDLQKLVRFREAVDEITRFGIQILVPPPTIVSAAAIASQQHGLLSGDALVIALMLHFGLSQLASHDADFDRVPGITRYAPA